jgi:putative ABC transport system substrate-binding protein
VSEKLKRREFITLIGGAAVAWPIAARAQHAERIPRIGVLVGFAENDPLAEAHIAAFREGLRQLGWKEATIRFDVRFAGADPDRMRAHATELVGVAPDVILAQTTPVTAALLRETRKIPIVFVIVSDPVGSGFVETLSHPGS